MNFRTILTGAFLTSFSLATFGVTMDPPKVEDIVPSGPVQQPSNADPVVDGAIWNTSLEFGVDGTIDFMYFGLNEGGLFPNGTTNIEFEVGEEDLLGKFSISDGAAGAAGLSGASDITLDGTLDNGEIFIGEDGNPVIKLIGSVVGDGGRYGPEGSPVGIVLDFGPGGVSNLRNGFSGAFGVANVFALTPGTPSVASEGSTLLLLLGGGLGVLAAGLRRRGRADA